MPDPAKLHGIGCTISEDLTKCRFEFRYALNANPTLEYIVVIDDVDYVESIDPLDDVWPTSPTAESVTFD
jgi:hypothetical protein